jgi:hypothetical protein
MARFVLHDAGSCQSLRYCIMAFHFMLALAKNPDMGVSGPTICTKKKRFRSCAAVTAQLTGAGSTGGLS